MGPSAIHVGDPDGSDLWLGPHLALTVAGTGGVNEWTGELFLCWTVTVRVNVPLGFCFGGAGHSISSV